MLEDYLDVLTVKEVREILFIGRNKVYELLASGQLKGFKVGKDWRVNKKELIQFIEQ